MVQNGKTTTCIPDAELRRIQSFEYSVKDETEGRDIYCGIGETKNGSLCIKYDDSKFETTVWISGDYPGIDFDGLLKDALAKKIGHKEIAGSVKNILTDIATGKCQDKGVIVKMKPEKTTLSDDLGGTVYCHSEEENVTYMSFNFGKGSDGKHRISQISRAEIIKGLIESPEEMFDKIEKTISDDNQKSMTEKEQTIHSKTGSQKSGKNHGKQKPHDRFD